MDYKKTAEEVSEKVLFYLHDTEGWQVVKSTKHMDILAKPSTEFPGLLYRTEVSLEIPLTNYSLLFTSLKYKTHRSIRHTLVFGEENKKKLIGGWIGLPEYPQSEDTFIYRSITHSYGLGMVSPRDFVYMLHVKTYDGNLMTTNSISVVHPNLLPTPAYIRGTTFSSGYACLPLPENPEHTRLTIIAQVDLGGFLMPSVINSVMPMCLINFVNDCKTGLKMLRETIT